MIWKTINEYPAYQVSDTGLVRSLYRTHGASGKRINTVRMLKPGTDGPGYLTVHLCKNSTLKTYAVHRLVLAAFVGSCPDGLEANHLDGDKLNNRIGNLEWITSSENMLHAFRMGLQVPSISNEKAVIRRTKAGGFIAEYRSQSEASRRTGIHRGSISSCCAGKLKSAGGFVWRFA